ncbi:MAG: hypothetical protein KIS91_16965 [Anaerolineae bacterium]|nr:hypothetical protein [Anaerolineae bacterium]
MQAIGTLISALVMLGLAGFAGILGLWTFMGGVRGPAERRANRAWYRVFMVGVSLILFVLALGCLNSVGQMLGLIPQGAIVVS